MHTHIRLHKNKSITHRCDVSNSSIVCNHFLRFVVQLDADSTGVVGLNSKDAGSGSQDVTAVDGSGGSLQQLSGQNVDLW